MTEDDVKLAMKKWLKRQGYKQVDAKMGTAKGIDVEGVDAKSDIRLAIECKGATSTTGKHFTWHQSWVQTAGALFNAIKMIEKPENNDQVAIAFPDTEFFQRRMSGLYPFCQRQGITVFWVSPKGRVSKWAEPG